MVKTVHNADISYGGDKETRATASQAQIIIDTFGRDNPVDDLALVLFEAWVNADPSSSVALYPIAYLATFADMARASIAWSIERNGGF